MRNQTLHYVLMCFLLAVPCWASTIVVDQNGFGNFTNIQAAINGAEDLDTVLVRSGTYYEKINFQGKAITVTSTDPNSIDVVQATVIDGGSSGNVVTLDNLEDDTSELDGFTVQNGNPYGIYCSYSYPFIRKCVVRNNSCGIKGNPALPTVLECTVEYNTGNGIESCNGEISNCTMANNSTGLNGCGGDISGCTVEHNTSDGLFGCGGNISGSTIEYNSGSGLSSCGNISNCTIGHNSSYGSVNCGNMTGCEVINNNSDGIDTTNGLILNCIIAGNRGQGLSATWWYSGTVEIRNCTIAGNKGSGVVNQLYYGTVLIANSIIVRNQGYGITSASLKYNNVWSNFSGNYQSGSGPTDIHVNPLFSSSGYWDSNDSWVNGDYHLRSTAGRWKGSSWVNDTVSSPCIDAGDPNDNVGYEPDPNGAKINMGAYGGTAQASKSPSGIVQPVCTSYSPMDFNKDCKVDFEDFAIFANSWLECNLDPPSACGQ